MYVIRRNMTYDYLKVGSGSLQPEYTPFLQNARTFRRRSSADKVAGTDRGNEIGYVGHVDEFLQEPE